LFLTTIYSSCLHVDIMWIKKFYKYYTKKGCSTLLSLFHSPSALPPSLIQAFKKQNRRSKYTIMSVIFTTTEIAIMEKLHFILISIVIYHEYDSQRVENSNGINPIVIGSSPCSNITNLSKTWFLNSQVCLKLSLCSSIFK